MACERITFVKNMKTVATGVCLI